MMKQISVKKSLLVWSILSVLSFFPILKQAHAADDFSLPKLQKDILTRYDGVSHLSAQALAEKMKQSGEDIILFDVREPGEFKVSHLPGAIQVAPNIWHGPFMQKYSTSLKGKTVVFYCSVGVRSSKLARYVQAAAKKAGAKAVVNLEHGIFGWHNEARPLTNQKAETELVHPYDKHWGQLVKRNGLISYQPAQ